MTKLTWKDFKEQMIKANVAHQNITGVIVFAEDSFKAKYPLDSRSYRVHSSEKIFNPSACGYSMFGSSLDGTDCGVRLEHYMREEGWTVDYCYFEKE